MQDEGDSFLGYSAV